MSAPAAHTPSTQARNPRRPLDGLVEEAPGTRSVAAVSSDGVLLLASDPGRIAERRAGQAGGNGGEHGTGSSGAGPAAVVRGLGSLTRGVAELMGAGPSDRPWSRWRTASCP